MICLKCGKESPNGTAFCSNCGYQFGSIGQLSEAQKGPVEKSEELQWYFYEGKEKKGPFSEAEMLKMVEKGTIERKSKLYKEGDNGWITAGDADWYPPVPLDSLSDRWLWIMAVIPGIDVLGLITNIVGPYEVAHAIWNLPPIILYAVYIVCCCLDQQELKKAGIGKMPWYVWLVWPVYIFCRAAKTTKNMKPGILWSVLFLISCIWFSGILWA